VQGGGGVCHLDTIVDVTTRSRSRSGSGRRSGRRSRSRSRSRGRSGGRGRSRRRGRSRSRSDGCGNGNSITRDGDGDVAPRRGDDDHVGIDIRGRGWSGENCNRSAQIAGGGVEGGDEDVFRMRETHRPEVGHVLRLGGGKLAAGRR